jgi:hypothetical protein
MKRPVFMAQYAAGFSIFIDKYLSRYKDMNIMAI